MSQDLKNSDSLRKITLFNVPGYYFHHQSDKKIPRICITVSIYLTVK